MNKFLIKTLVLFYIPFNLYAVGVESVQLAQIAASTAAELSETLKLVGFAESQVSKIEQARAEIQKRVNISRNLISFMETVKSLENYNIENINEFNSSLRRLKAARNDGINLLEEIDSSFKLNEVSKELIVKSIESDKSILETAHLRNNDSQSDYTSAIASLKDVASSNVYSAPLGTELNTAKANVLLSKIHLTLLRIETSLAQRGVTQSIEREASKGVLENFLSMKMYQDIYHNHKSGSN